MTQTTGSGGAFLLYAPSNQVITVTEANPTDYVSTNAIPGNDASKVDNDILRVSALSGGSTSAGNFFGDALPADLTVVKSDSPALVVTGRTLTYTLVYTNNGPSHAQGVYITDTLPDSIIFGGVVSVAPALFGPTWTSQSLTWYTPTLAAGASGTIVFTVTVDADASGTITNSVVITSNMPDTSPGNNDDDEPTAIAPTVDFSSATYSVDEGAGTAIITVTLDAASGLTATVDYATSDGTAVAGDDYTAISGTLTFTPGITSQTFSLNITSDTLYENDETVSLTLSNPGNATLGGNNPATLTIEDNDDPPTISINYMAVTEGDVGTTNAVFTVTLAAASGELVTVDYATADGTATAGADYTAISTTTLSFHAGTMTQTITVQVIGDTQDEGDETFFVNLGNPTNATIADNQGMGTITGDDVSPPGPGGVYLPIIVCKY